MKKQPYPITQLTGGIDVSLDPTLLEDRLSPNILEVYYGDGILKKDMGKLSVGLPLLGTPCYMTRFYSAAGVNYVLCMTTTSSYKLNTTTLEWEDITLGEVICDCESAWTASANVTSTADTSVYKLGSKSAKHVIAALHTTGVASYLDFGAKDLTSYTHVHLWVYSSIALAAGDIQLLLDNTPACASPIETLDIPALVANTWTRVSLTLAAPASCGAIASVGLQVAVDKGACTIYLDDIRAVKEFTGTLDNFFSSATLNDTIVITNGVDALQKWAASGTFAALGGSPPTKAVTICTFMNRLVCGGVMTGGVFYPHRVQWSSIGTTETWSGGTSGWTDLLDTMDWVMSIRLLKSQCVVYKEKSIWELVYVGGTKVFRAEMRIGTMGTLAPNTIVDRGETHLLFSEGNILEYDLLRTSTLADALRPLLYETGSKIISFATCVRAFAIYSKSLQTYIICFPEEEIMFKYNLLTKGWTRFNSRPIYCFGEYEAVAAPIAWSSATGTWAAAVGSWARKGLPANAPTVLMGWNTGQMYEDDRVTLSSEEMIWETRDFLFGHAHRLTEVRLEYNYGGVEVEYSTNRGLTYTSLGSLPEVEDWSEGVLYLDITTQQIRFRLSTTAQRFELKWLEPWYVPRVRSKELTT